MGEEARPGPGAQEDDSRENYSIGEYGHRVPAESAIGGISSFASGRAASATRSPLWMIPGRP